MFTGIIEHRGTVVSLERNSGGGRIRVRAEDLVSTLSVSASIAVNGCCLTVVEHTATEFSADLSPETLRRTTFGQMSVGSRVNLERPLTAGKEIGGHFVQGHVDGLGRIVRLEREGASGGFRREQTERKMPVEDVNWWLEIEIPSELLGFVAEKGSVAIDGISLTIASLRGNIASFAIIPYTYTYTNLSGLRAGDPVNLEADILAKYVERLLEARRTSAGSRLNLQQLVEEGF